MKRPNSPKKEEELDFYAPSPDRPLMESASEDAIRNVLIGELRRYRWPTDIPKFEIIATNRDEGLAAETVRYRHRLGRIPRGAVAFGVSSTGGTSQGAWDGKDQNCVYFGSSGQAGATRLLRLVGSGSARVEATLVKWAQDHIDVAWGRQGNPTGTATFVIMLIG